MNFKPFPELADILLREQCETSDGYWHITSSKGRCILLTNWFLKIHPTSHQFPPALKKLKVATLAMSLR